MKTSPQRIFYVNVHGDNTHSIQRGKQLKCPSRDDWILKCDILWNIIQSQRAVKY